MIMPYKPESLITVYRPERVGGVSDLFEKFSYVMKGYARIERKAKKLPKAERKNQEMPEEFVEQFRGFVDSPTQVLGLCMMAQGRDVSHYKVLTNLFDDRRVAVAKILQQKGYSLSERQE